MRVLFFYLLLNVCRIARNVRAHVRVPAIECNVRMPNAIVSLWNHMRPFWFYYSTGCFFPPVDWSGTSAMHQWMASRTAKWPVCVSSIEGINFDTVIPVLNGDWSIGQFSRFASRLISNFALRTWHSVCSPFGSMWSMNGCAFLFNYSNRLKWLVLG